MIVNIVFARGRYDVAEVVDLQALPCGSRLSDAAEWEGLPLAFILSAGVLAAVEGSGQCLIEFHFAELIQEEKLSPKQREKIRFFPSETRSFDYGEYAFAQDQRSAHAQD